jgi:hypothetical protein
MVKLESQPKNLSPRSFVPAPEDGPPTGTVGFLRPCCQLGRKKTTNIELVANNFTKLYEVRLRTVYRHRD